MQNLIGQQLGRYRVIEQIGRGGMATVYKAYDIRLERDVAVKIIRVDQFAPVVLEHVLKRFEREAKALAKLTHPNIVHINDFGEQDGIPYLVMDYLPGGTLKERLGKPMPWQESVHLLLPIAQALKYAHAEGIVHRDVKPSNILVARSGDLMLADFGIAKLLQSDDIQTFTGTGSGAGTPEYMAPEQVDARQVDGRADIYSLGVVLYELITGFKPYTADTPLRVLVKQLHEPLLHPSKFIPDLPEEVEKVLLKALSKKPEDRYADMATFTNSLVTLFNLGNQLLTGNNKLGEPIPFTSNDAENANGTMDRDATISQLEAPDIMQATKTIQGETPIKIPAKQPSSASRTWGAVIIILILLMCGIITASGALVGGFGIQGKGPLAWLATATPTYVTTTPTITSTYTFTPSEIFTLTFSPIPPTDTQLPSSTRTPVPLPTKTSVPPPTKTSAPPAPTATPWSCQAVDGIWGGALRQPDMSTFISSSSIENLDTVGWNDRATYVRVVGPFEVSLYVDPGFSTLIGTWRESGGWISLPNNYASSMRVTVIGSCP